MKLETAYRKLNRHTGRWFIEITHGCWRHVKARMKHPVNIPRDLQGDYTGTHPSGNPFRFWCVRHHRHTEAVNAMAIKLDKVEAAIHAWEEAERLKKEVVQ